MSQATPSSTPVETKIPLDDNRLVWVDMEMTGLDPFNDKIIEVAVVVTDSELNVLEEGPVLAIHQSDENSGRDGCLEHQHPYFMGRGRKSQMALAAHYGITNYPTPAGGRLLADPIISARVRWTFNSFQESGVQEMLLTSLGRHFALAEKTLLVVGRFEKENVQIAQLGRQGDMLLELLDRPGPVSLLRGPRTQEIIRTAASITAYHSKAREVKQVEVSFSEVGSGLQEVIKTDPISQEALEGYRIA